MVFSATFGTGRLGPSLTVGVPGGAPVPAGATVLHVLFDPAPPATAAEASALADAVAAARAGGACVVGVAVGRVRRATLAAGAPAAKEALAKAAAARLAAPAQA